jgi:hypothetical protein
MKNKNELIQNIADKYESPDQNAWYYSIRPSSYEEFAKAIINECIKSIENAVDRFGPTAVDDIKETIRNHFGE